MIMMPEVFAAKKIKRDQSAIQVRSPDELPNAPRTHPNDLQNENPYTQPSRNMRSPVSAACQQLSFLKYTGLFLH
jgi:hypothetical protein